MSKLLLNTGLVPLYDANGSPIEPGRIVLSDELGDDAAALEESGALVHVKPSELPEEEKHSLLSDAAREHASGNAARASGDDAGVKKSSSKGGQS